MTQQKLTIQNIVLKNDVDANIQDYFEFMYAPNVVSYNAIESAHVIYGRRDVSFASYFNCLQAQVWGEKTNARGFGLHLKFKGQATLEVFACSKSAKNISRDLLAQVALSSDEISEIDIDFEKTSKKLVYFKLATHSDFYIYDASYYAYVNSEDVKDVRISLVTTTFKKEEYISKNARLIKSKVLCEGSDIRDNIFVHIIDNGRTLNVEEFDSHNLKVYPNANVGGAGGFTRGMIEAIESEFNPTHVLLMDDDVLVVAESLFRTYYMLRILKDEYSSAFLSGAMFDYDIRETQYEDVGYVNKERAGYGPIKHPLDMRNINSLLDNEDFDINSKKDSYAGWWYCCIPVKCINENGLPLPVFIRGDDVEYSIRNGGGFVALNGICIWHVGFAGKFNAAMELYQVHRNSFVIQAVSDICRDVDFLTRIKGLFWQQIAKFAYSNAEQLIDSIDDFLKGPEFLMNLNGESCLKEHAGKNEKMISLDELGPEFDAIKYKNPYEFIQLRGLKKLIYKCSLNGHLFFNFMLKKKPELIAYDWFNSPGRNYLKKTLLAVNPHDQTGIVRKIDRKRCFALIKRYKKVVRKYKKTYNKVAQAYRDCFGQMTSVDFWKKYLNI